MCMTIYLSIYLYILYIIVYYYLFSQKKHPENPSLEEIVMVV